MANAQQAVLEKYKKIKKFTALLSGSTGILILVVAIFFLVILTGMLADGDSKSGSGGGMVGIGQIKNLPPEVMRWKDMVEKECAAQGVPEFVPYVLGIIMVESNGISEKLPDIMQSSESQGWNMNTISNPKDSIYYGVMHLKGVFTDAKELGITDLSAIV
ncbi:lysozyme family protein, partial [Bacillus cereus]